jgi:hypothetical protein
MIIVLVKIRKMFFSEMLLLDDSRQRYHDRFFYFTGQGD